MSTSAPKQTAQQKQLEGIQIERERQLRVENARATTKQFDEQIQFRRKLRGIFSLLSSGFTGFSSGSGSSGTQLGT